MSGPSFPLPNKRYLGGGLKRLWPRPTLRRKQPLHSLKGAVVTRVEVQPTGARDGDQILASRRETSQFRMTTAKQPTARARCETEVRTRLSAH